jgi:hypothetical protein
VKPTLWIFGHSVCLPCDIEGPGWADIISQDLDADCKNFAKVAADNFFIYNSYLLNRPLIQSQDLVIIGWSHPSRKSFVLDRTNENHLAVLGQSFIYDLGELEFIRSHNIVNDTLHKWLNLKPKDTNKLFYDNWFNNYYSEHEQQCHLRSYLDSVTLTCQGRYLPFYFSAECMKPYDVNQNNFILDFITKHEVFISKKNMHLNKRGHELWANHLWKQI